MIFQHTLKNAVRLRGVGVHSGATVELVLHPAPVNTGIIFRRTDLNNLKIPAKIDYIGDTDLCTCLVKDAAKIATIEHLLSAFSGLGIDNAHVDLTLPELPIMDGSAEPFVNLIESAGILEQSAPRQFIRIKKTVEVKVGDKWARLELHDGFHVSMQISYDHPVILNSPQSVSFEISKDIFVQEISRARTFGFYKDYQMILEKNLAKGASLENTVVITDDGLMNPEGLRYPDEFVKHKMLDAIGDLYLLGHPIIGAFSGYKSGHAMNSQLIKALLADKTAWELVYLSGSPC